MSKFPAILSPILRNRTSSFLLSGAVLLQFGLTYFDLPGWQCPIFQATGIPCPGCGLSRASIALLHGDWQGAFRLHVFAPVLLLGLIVFLIVTLLPKNYRQRMINKLEEIEVLTGVSFIFLVGLLFYWGIRFIVAPAEFIMLINDL